MRIDLSHEEVIALRDVLQQKVKELDKEINRADSLRYKDRLRNIERTLEHVLGSVSQQEAGRGPDDWEPRDAVTDADQSASKS